MPSIFLPSALNIWAEQTSSRPGPPGTKFQVVCCGLPRTGTTSTGEAVGKLLGGPVADGGCTARTGDPDQQKLLNSLVWDGHLPMKDLVDKTWVKHRLAQLTTGFVTASDAPYCYFVEELAEMYPDAKFICTVREKASWWRSYMELCARIHKITPFSWASPTVWRYCMYCWGIADNHVRKSMNLPNATATDMTTFDGLWEAHAEYIKRVVPADRLFYYSVKDGWDPLCKILDKPVPNEPFPSNNTKTVMDGREQEASVKLKQRIAVLLGSAVSSIAVLVAYREPVLHSLANAAQAEAVWLSKALTSFAS